MPRHPDAVPSVDGKNAQPIAYGQPTLGAQVELNVW
eukprot:CAMPEP_0174301952 /NCGR_PEP_ID=MMETSP0809-20121228/59350_1 /TAXON_ID=73025 ORGANISM="Eutreptiella gymnastica-like, Strain CCMP1594" /NCGR_SAMPLE_ID=MMETSP0809 /ASSEMBLY_ACC=CAM_ASM_000658 /LENGTH=35 /DNA_ID= /DNA_START= /DNA_END= /DNA_ORIENTATION=